MLQHDATNTIKLVICQLTTMKFIRFIESFSNLQTAQCIFSPSEPHLPKTPTNRMSAQLNNDLLCFLVWRLLTFQLEELMTMGFLIFPLPKQKEKITATTSHTTFFWPYWSMAMLVRRIHGQYSKQRTNIQFIITFSKLV